MRTHTRRPPVRGALCVLAALLVTLLGAVPAFAEDVSWTVATADNGQGRDRPNYTYAVEPGSVVSDGIVVSNAGTRAITLSVYAADAFTTSSGHLDLLPAGQKSTDVGAWVKPAADKVELQPGQSKTVAFTLRVPKDAAPGDHSGGIVTSYVDTTPGTSVSVDRRLGARIHVRVAGELAPAVTVGDVSVDVPVAVNPFVPVTATVRYRLANTGNTRVFGHETVRLTGPAGLAATTAAAETPEVVPGSTIDREVRVSGVWPLGLLTAHVDVVPETVGGETTDAVSASRDTVAVPWGALGLLVLILAAGIGVGVWNHRRRWEWVPADEPGPEGTEAPAEPRDPAS
jgi:hypothetical protein